MVPVKKSNGKIRLCGDYKETVNPAIDTDTYQTDSPDTVITKLGPDNKVFAEVDLEDAYTQCSVDEETSRVLTINTPRGLFRVTTLPFGIKCASAAFQRVVDAVVGGLEGVVSYQDIIYVAAPDSATLKKRLYKVLQNLSEAGLRVNKEKCTWETRSLEVLGFRVDAEGVHPLPSRVQAIKETRAPTCVKELQQLLGLINFYAKFLKSKATILEPLHRLLDSKSAWTWNKEHQHALDTVKEMLTSEQVLAHYSPTAPLLIAVDASSFGVGAVLSHIMKEGKTNVERPIMFASRTLSKAERSYSQLDREALAIMFAIRKFHRYILCRKFTIVIDHLPLVGIFKPNAPIPDFVPPRRLRWILTVACYDCNIVYKPGKSIPHADYLSIDRLFPSSILQRKSCLREFTSLRREILKLCPPGI